MPGSRLLPAEQRAALPAAPTTSRWWRTHVLVRSWLNRHRHHWLAPLLVCAPPVGVAMVWAGASRPGHARRYLTAAAAVWSLVLLIVVLLVTLPGGTVADAGTAPSPIAGGPALTPGPTASATDDPASAAAEVRGAPPRAAGVGAASVVTAPDPSNPQSGSSSPGGSSSSGGNAASGAGAAGGGAANPGPASTPASTPRATTTPKATTKPPKATPTPKRTPERPTSTPTRPSIPTANPFTPCPVEGAQALSPNGFPLRCYRTPIGLFWLWGR